MKKAIIVDLDNTIYPVSSIGDHLFTPLLQAIEASGEFPDKMADIRADVMRKPFHLIAKKHRFSHALTKQCDAILTNLTYDKPMQPFDDYALLRTLPMNKYLVTSGYRNMQWSKIQQLGIEKDFTAIHIVDPQTSTDTKKIVFERICLGQGYKPEEVLVVGDDLESEIKAGIELGMEVVLFDRIGFYNDQVSGLPTTKSFRYVVDYCLKG
ncbi:MAG: HAD family hydrolase [Candidatus Pseudobacter hemicellulosilyticus]|uniref:HAD family hydrolase n=1 Tax=Candidatus Pseudobacter hemicellulosilyticus TaxID=3121375 RepID=A0AAJ5WPC3_9BACT|nr:MAG: HAD family hydrolase [Pseudobacter sp.]